MLIDRARGKKIFFLMFDELFYARSSSLNEKSKKKGVISFAIGDDALYRLLERVSTCSILDGTSETRSRSKLTAIIASNVRPPRTCSPSIYH